MEAGLEMDITKSGTAEDDDAWLYGGQGMLCLKRYSDMMAFEVPSK